MKEARAGAAERFRNLDAHDAEVEQLGDEPVGDSGLLVHLADQRPDFAVGELVDAVAKQALRPRSVSSAAGWSRQGDVSLNRPE